MPPPPGMFCGMTVGLPGRCLLIWSATTRPHMSLEPPVPEPIIMVTFLPASVGACAATGGAANSVAAVRRPSARAYDFAGWAILTVLRVGRIALAITFNLI